MLKDQIEGIKRLGMRVNLSKKYFGLNDHMQNCHIS